MGMYWTIDSIGPTLYAVRLLHGIAGATLYAGLFTYAADHVPELRRTEGLALFGTSGLIPIALGAVLGDWLLEGGSYRTLFQGSFLCALTAVGICALLHEAERVPTGWEPPRGLSASLRQPELIPVWCVAAIFFSASALIFTFLKTHVLAFAEGSVGPFFSAYAVIAIALRLFLGSLPDRFGAERVLGPALCAYALGLILLGATLPGQVTLVTSGLLCGAGHGYAYPILFSMVVRRARPSERGTSLAIYTAIEEAAFLVGSPLLGWTIQQVGYFAAFSATGLCVIAGAAVLRLWDRATAASSPVRWP
jgi:MFS family permease